MKITDITRWFAVRHFGGEVVRYSLVMVTGYAIDFLSFMFFLKVFGVDAVLSGAFSKGLSSIYSYFAHALFTFHGKPEVISRDSAAKYFFVVAINVPLSSALLYFIDFFIKSGVVSKILSDVLMLLFTYAQTKFVVFGKKAS